MQVEQVERGELVQLLPGRSGGNLTACERAAGMNSPPRSWKPTSPSCQVPGRGSFTNIWPQIAGSVTSKMPLALKPLKWM